MTITQKRILDHLEHLVAFYPASHEQKNVGRLLEYCADCLQQTGSFTDVKLVEYSGIKNLVASTQSTKKPRLLLQGHVDVVPAPEKLRTMLRKGNAVHGRGVIDMLYATACFLTFVQEHANQLAKLDIGIMLTGDEELGGEHGVKALLEDGYGGDICILPDAGRNFKGLNSGAKGVYSFDLRVTGKAHHSSRPWEGDGAGNKLVELLHELLSAFDASDQNNSTVTVTKLAGGDAMNKGPAETLAHVDIRYRDDTDLLRITTLLATLCKRYNAHIENLSHGNAYDLDLQHSDVVSFVALFSKLFNEDMVPFRAHGSSDARFFAAHDIPVIMFLPKGTGAHADQETLNIDSLMQFYQMLEAYILQTATIEADYE